MMIDSSRLSLRSALGLVALSVSGLVRISLIVTARFA